MTRLRLSAWAGLLGMVLVLGVGPAVGQVAGAAVPAGQASAPQARGPHFLPLAASGPVARSLTARAATAAAAGVAAHLSYYGGKVLSSVKVVQVIYGSGTYLAQTTASASPSVSSFFAGVTTSPLFDWLSEYNTTISAVGGQRGTSQTIGRGTFGGQYVISPAAANNGSTIQDANIQSELKAQIAAGHLPAPDGNTLYSIFFRNGQSICSGSSCSLVSGGFCAYHNTIASGSVPELYYTVEPDLSNVVGCGAGAAFQNTTSVASHELIESVTDPEVGLAVSYGPPLSWYDPNYGEIGDVCNGQQATVTGGDGVAYTVQKEFSDVAGACIVSRTVTNDFSLAANPVSVSVLRGAAVTATVATTVTSGTAQSVVLSASSLPAGISATFAPATVTAGTTAALTLTTSAAAVAGTYVVTVTGTGASASHATALSLVVSAPVTSNFSLSASPGSVSVVRGSSGTATIATAITSGSAQSVALTASGLPAGASASFSPATISAGATSRLTLAIGATTPAGTFNLTITGSGPSATHATTLALVLSVPVTAGITNGGFEGGLGGWSGTGSVAASTVAHSGSGSAMVGAATPSLDAAVAQTFTAPSGTNALSFWYQVRCPDTVSYDWASATLRDSTAGSTATILGPTCTNNVGVWVHAIPASLIAGHSYTVTLASHDDNFPGDPTYTLYDDVAIAPVATPAAAGITNGGFEAGGLSGWTAAGASVSVVSTGCRSGSYCARLGSTVASNGGSSIAQTFTAPALSTLLTFGYRMACTGAAAGDSATATLRDSAGGTLVLPLPMLCSFTGWWRVGVNVTAGHTYTLTIVNHNSNRPSDPTHATIDDVALS